MKYSHTTAFLLITFFACAAPGCPHEKWMGPSSFYQSLDKIEREDGRVMKTEWEAMYGTCMIHSPSPGCSWYFTEHLAEFDCMDQDKGGYLSWSEYYDFRFTNKKRVDCPLLYQLRRNRPVFDQNNNFALHRSITRIFRSETA